jgi:glycosyltransferase involved in cell wall biosynthesis
MKISIVTAYYNRKNLFYNTLRSIESLVSKDSVEIIVVDDASREEERIESFVDKFDLDLKIIRIEQKDKWWTNPCIPFNIGFKNATGDVIIIQNPECIHMGNIIKFVEENIQDNVYLNFGCYSIDEKLTRKITNSIQPDFNKVKVNNLIYPTNNCSIVADGETAWYNHSKYRPHQLHFCSAITKNNLVELGGFDERYADGIGFDDNEFLLRIKRKNMLIKMIDNPFVLHQYHYSGTPMSQQNRLLFGKNGKLYYNISQNEKNIKIQDL